MKFIKMELLGFTLAEVLIVIGVIGIIAELTIPDLVSNYQKQVTVIRLQKVYSTLNQAIKLSEIDNGPSGEWDFGEKNTGSSEWFKIYLAPYMRYQKIDDKSVILSDGTIVYFWYGDVVDLNVYLDPVQKAKDGRGFFKFNIYQNTNLGLVPYGWNIPECKGTRDCWVSTGWHGCSKTGDKAFCAALMMYDGWQIKDDYPW